MLKTGKIALAFAAGLLASAFAATAPTASAAPAADFAVVKSVEYGSYLHPEPDRSVVLGDPHEWVFTRTPSGAYMIRTSNLPGAPCLTSEGDGQPVVVAVCRRPGVGGQYWRLTHTDPDQSNPVLIESADYPDEVLEAHGTGTMVTLESKTNHTDQQWEVSGPEED
ncbi:RICIN domain-containing protein [Streptomyces acidicola]|uniref:RICIN domain-containing protein n=1 Tax=Streptomyces acidicola TaxID=2596892 RepID=UPI0037FEF95B